MVICLERGADCLHMVHLMPLPYQIPRHLMPHLNPDWFLSFWYRLANPGCPGKEAVKTGVVVVGYLGNPTCIGLVIIQLSLVFMLFLQTCLVIRITAVFKGVTGLTPPPEILRRKFLAV